MKVSLLVPIYGVELFIERCAKSLFEQTYEDIEYVFVDDCSPDRSIDILIGLLDEYPKRKKQTKIVRHEHNQGLGAARNTAVSVATGEFVMHVDSDDYLNSECVRLCVEEQKRSSSDIVSFDAIVYRAKYNERRSLPLYKSPENLLSALLRRDIPVNIWGRLIRKSLYTEHEIKVERGVNMSEDWNVIPRLVFYSSSISSISNALYYYDCRNVGSYTSSYSKVKYQQVWDSINVLQDFFNTNCKECCELLNFGVVKVLSIQILDIAKSKDYEEDFLKLKKLYACYDPKYSSHLNVGTRIALKIDNYKILKMFVTTSVFLKRVTKSIIWTFYRKQN